MKLESSQKAPPFIPSVRFIVAIMACLCLAIQYAQRMNLTMGIVCMVNKTAVSELQLKADQDRIASEFSVNRTLPNTLDQRKDPSVKKPKKFKDGPFVWTRPVQGRILSAYFFGYIAFQVGGAVMAARFGPYRVLMSAMMFGTLTTFLTAPLAQYSYVIVIVLRVLTGLSAGMVWPAMVELCARWSPASEKSKMLAIGNSGAQIGPLVSMPLFGALCASSVLGGWQLVFYVSGAFGIVWCLACLLLVTSEPQHHRFMSQTEKQYLKENAILRTGGASKKDPHRLPFLKLMGHVFRTRACWAMFSSHFFKAFGFYTILTNVSTYNEEILHLDLKSSGYLTAIPYICYWICTIGSGWAADFILKRNILQAGACRKLFTGLGSFGPAVTVFALGFIDHRMAWLGIAMIALTLAFLGCNSGGGMYIVCQDMAPKYSATLWGMSNTFGTAPGIIVPLVIGTITKNRLLREWRIVFTICAASYILSGLVFIIWGSGELQEWAKEPVGNADEKERINLRDSKGDEMKTFGDTRS